MKHNTPDLSRIQTIHTLGGPETNCNMAAHEWFARRSQKDGDVILHRTLEDAIANMPHCVSHALMACAAYPKLNDIVFANLDWLEITDCLVVDTHPMVLASRDGRAPRTVTTHPAPRLLVPADVTDIRLATSNAQAAAECARGETDGCITTLMAMNSHGLMLVTDFGPLPMAFTIHTYRSTRSISV